MRADNGAYSFWGYNNFGRIWVEGAERTSGSTTAAVNAWGDTYICSWTGDIYHNGDGSKIVAVGWAIDSGYAGGCSNDVSFALTKINRYPVLNSGMNFKDTENPTLDITAYNTYPLRVKLEAGGNAQLITRNLTNKESQKYTIELTQEERDTLRGLMTGDTLPVRETVCAMSGNTELSASFKDYTMTRGNRGARILVNGTWKEAIPYVGVNGQWKEAITYIGVNNQWKEGI